MPCEADRLHLGVGDLYPRCVEFVDRVALYGEIKGCR